MSKRLICLFLALCLLLAGCHETEEEGNFSVYFRDQNKAELVAVKAGLDSGLELSEKLSAIWTRMCDSSEGSGYISAVPAGLTILSFSLTMNNLILNFGKEYPEVNTQEELLLRAAVIKTFSQLEEVSTVEFYVESQMLTDPEGNVLGPQKSSHYVDVMEQGLNDYHFVSTVLYYANPSGNALVRVREEIAYQNETSLAQQVIGRLIAGPEESGACSALPSGTKLISLTLRDGVCYVNLNNAVEEVEFTVAPEIMAYAIVNSLTELSGISSVSLSVNGSSGMFLKTVDISKPLTRNLDYVETSSDAAKE